MPRDVTLAEFQQLIRQMYLEKDLARGIDGTFMWLMEEIGELATALRNGTQAGAERRVRRRAGLAGHDRQRGGHRPDRGDPGEIRLRLPGLRPAGVHLPGCGEAMRQRLGCLLLALCCFSGRLRPHAEQTRPPEFVGVRVGLGGCYKAGLWTPVEVTLRGGSEACRGRVSLTVPDGDGVASRVVTPPDEPVSLSPGKETTVGLNVRFGRVRGSAGGGVPGRWPGGGGEDFHGLGRRRAG